MGKSTAQGIERGRGEAHDPARRRKLARDVRSVRERLTSSIGLERAFDYELLRLYAQSRISASGPLFILALAVAAIATIWIPLQNTTVSLVLVATGMALMLRLSQRFLDENPDSVSLEA